MARVTGRGRRGQAWISLGATGAVYFWLSSEASSHDTTYWCPGFETASQKELADGGGVLHLKPL